MTPIDVSVDIETLDTIPDARITEIGAVQFERLTGKVLKSFRVQLLKPGEHLGRTVSANTRLWWKDTLAKSDTIPPWWLYQTHYTLRPEMAEHPDLHSYATGLKMFQRWMDATEFEFVWAKGPHFDISILESSLRACMYPVPWSYRQPRDVRTLLGFTHVAPVNPAPSHDAVKDAIEQAQDVANCYATDRGVQLSLVTD